MEQSIYSPNLSNRNKSELQQLLWFKAIIHMEFLFLHLIENVSWRCLGFSVSFWIRLLLLIGSPNLPYSSLEGSPCREPGEGVGFFFCHKVMIKHIIVINNGSHNNYYCFLNYYYFFSIGKPFESQIFIPFTIISLELRRWLIFYTIIDPNEVSGPKRTLFQLKWGSRKQNWHWFLFFWK